MAFGFFKKIVKTAGKGVRSVAKVTGSVAKGLGHVPVVGGGLKGVYNLTFNAPFKTANAIASGQRLDKVALNTIKEHVRDVKDVAPYAQMVISVVPGVGQGISGAIGAGLALASGQPVTEAIAAGVRSALPGGPVAQAAFDVGKAAISGKPISAIALQALPLNPQQKSALGKAMAAANAIASGKPVSAAAIDAAIAVLPSEARKGIQTGMALSEAQRLQANAAKSIDSKALASLAKIGASVVKGNPVLSAGVQIVKSAQHQGFAIATGMMQHKLTPNNVTSVRAKLKPEDKKGFDLAMAVNVGGLTTKAPARMPPREKFGYLAVKGSADASKSIKSAIAATLKTDNSTKNGAVVAIETGGNLGFWKRLYFALTGKVPGAKPGIPASTSKAA